MFNRAQLLLFLVDDSNQFRQFIESSLAKAGFVRTELRVDDRSGRSILQLRHVDITLMIAITPGHGLVQDLFGPFEREPRSLGQPVGEKTIPVA
jgi:hypothetical protein